MTTLGNKSNEGCQMKYFTLRKEKVKVKSLSRVRLFVTPWTIAYQAPPSMGFLRQQYWSGLLFPSPGDLPSPGIEPRVACIVGRCFHQGSPYILERALHTGRSMLFKARIRDFPGGPVAKAPCSQCREPGVRSLVREVDPTCCNKTQHSQRNK